MLLSVVIRAEYIATRDEAAAYYRERLGRAHTITCHKSRVTIVFERDATHLFSVKPADPANIPAGNEVTRAITGGRRVELREFSLERSRLMDHVLPAISKFTVSTPEAGGRDGFQKRVLYGPAINADNERLRVVLRPGPGDAWTCVSAYPVSADEWVAACRLKRAKFPP